MVLIIIVPWGIIGTPHVQCMHVHGGNLGGVVAIYM